MSAQPLNEYQQQALESLRRQQDAYLGAVRAWKKAASDTSNFSFPKMPEMPTAPKPEDWPSAAEMAEANQAFMNNVLEEQQRFFTSLNDILGGGTK